jgi:hypothetical protein
VITRTFDGCRSVEEISTTGRQPYRWVARSRANVEKPAFGKIAAFCGKNQTLDTPSHTNSDRSAAIMNQHCTFFVKKWVLGCFGI